MSYRAVRRISGQGSCDSMAAACAIMCAVVAVIDCTAYDRAEYAALVEGDGPRVVTGTDAAITRDGAPGDAATNAEAGQTCTDRQSNPCVDGIPRLSGVQVVDGMGDDLCAVPATVFDPAAGAVPTVDGALMGDAGPPPSLDATSTLRVAWSDIGLHVFVHVVKPAPITPARDAEPLYVADSVEIFAAGTAGNLTGPYGGFANSDVGAIHAVIAPPDPERGGAGRGALFQAGSGPSLTRLQPDQYASRLLEGDARGYAVEAVIYWSDLGRSQPPALAEFISFDFGLVVTVPDPDGGASVRFQSFLDSRPLPPGSSTPCGDDHLVAPYCDDRTWCPARLEN